MGGILPNFTEIRKIKQNILTMLDSQTWSKKDMLTMYDHETWLIEKTILYSL